MRNFVLAALLFSVLGAPRAVAAQVVAITADRLIDVAAGRIVEQPLVLVTDGRITAAGPRADVQVPAGARRIDLPGMGRQADLIAVAGNPIDDVRLLETVGFVMKGGTVIKEPK